MPKPRGQRSDKWKKRPCMVRYWAFKDRVREAASPHAGHIVATGQIHAFLVWVPMPQSWPAKRQAGMRGQPHQAGRNDIDNYLKGVLDTLFDNDGFIWSIGRLEKRWEDEHGPRIELWV